MRESIAKKWWYFRLWFWLCVKHFGLDHPIQAFDYAFKHHEPKDGEDTWWGEARASGDTPLDAVLEDLSCA